MVAFPKPQADRLSEMDEAPQGPPQPAQGSQPTPRWLPTTPNTVMLKSVRVTTHLQLAPPFPRQTAY